MANQRIFQVQAITTNGVAVGGTSTLSVNASYQDVVVSTPDGAIGAEDVDRAGLRVDVTLTCTDISKVNAILAGTVGDTDFYAQESGAATFHAYTIAGVVWHGFSIGANKNGDATLTLNGRVRLASGTTDIDDLIQLTGAQAAPSLTYPARLYRPHTASFDPTGADPAITPLHTQSLQMALAGNVISDYGDDDIGEAAVDVAGYQALTAQLVFRDALAIAGPPATDIGATLLAAGRGVLTLTLLGRGGAANQVLTINNLLWTGKQVSHQAGYSDYTMSGSAGWKEGATAYTVNSTNKLFEIAVPA